MRKRPFIGFVALGAAAVGGALGCAGGVTEPTDSRAANTAGGCHAPPLPQWQQSARDTVPYTQWRVFTRDRLQGLPGDLVIRAAIGGLTGPDSTFITALGGTVTFVFTSFDALTVVMPVQGWRALTLSDPNGPSARVQYVGFGIPLNMPC